jgi:pyruvate/2-oxoglutarate dehydrogenase complex dihydrolipoamide dehydrogenase (E3) component
MAIEYDLVIIGGTPEGYYAAERALQLGARVALIRQGIDGRRSQLYTQGILQTQRTHPDPPPPETPLSPWQWLTQRAAWIADTLTSDDWPRLMAQGGDVIDETGYITGDRPLTIETASRQLTTRGIVLATGHCSQAAAIPGLETIIYDTLESILQRETLPASVVVLGNSPPGLALCQLLNRWGVATTLVTTHARLLGHEDPEVSRWLTAQLYAEGVDLKLGRSVKAVAAAGGPVTLILADETVIADALIVLPPPRPNLRGLGLDDWLAPDHPLPVNAFLQTGHPRIFACGSVLGGYEMPAIARHEAQVAVQNALFWNRQRIDYRILPYDWPISPGMARVGLSETQARQRYGDKALLITQHSWYDHPQAQWQESTTGFCKVIAHRQGPILGVHSVGIEASECIQAAAWLMQQTIPWWQLSQLSQQPDTWLAALPKVAEQWDRDRWQLGQWRRNWAENWHNWRRSR